MFATIKAKATSIVRNIKIAAVSIIKKVKAIFGTVITIAKASPVVVKNLIARVRQEPGKVAVETATWVLLSLAEIELRLARVLACAVAAVLNPAISLVKKASPLNGSVGRLVSAVALTIGGIYVGHWIFSLAVLYAANNSLLLAAVLLPAAYMAKIFLVAELMGYQVHGVHVTI